MNLNDHPPLLTKASSDSRMAGVYWTLADTHYYMNVCERLFRERTPARRIDEIRWEDRVARSEMRNRCVDGIHKMPPEVDEEWTSMIVDWYNKMARRVIAELDPQYWERINANSR